MEPEGSVLDGVPLTELGADQVDEPLSESVVALAGVAITPQDMTDSVEGAAQILLRPSPPNTRKKETGAGRGDDESLEGLPSLEEVAGVTRAVIRALSRPTSQSPSFPIPQQPSQQQQPMEQDSILCLPQGRRDRG